MSLPAPALILTSSELPNVNVPVDETPYAPATVDDESPPIVVDVSPPIVVDVSPLYVSLKLVPPNVKLLPVLIKVF